MLVTLQKQDDLMNMIIKVQMGGKLSREETEQALQDLKSAYRHIENQKGSLLAIKEEVLSAC